MKFMVSIGVNHSPQFKMRSNSPLVANGYPLSGGNLSNIDPSCKNGLTGSATQPTFIIKYRYCIGRARCERPITG